MSLITIVVVLLIIGFVLYLINLTPIDGTIKNVIYAIILLFVIIWVLQVIGLVGPIGDVRIR